VLALLRRARLTAALLAVIGLGFVAETLLGGSTDPRVLVALGANVAPLDGAYWRLVASMFLHIGLLHLVVNAWALYQLGGLFELWLGARRLAVVFFVTGVAGSWASVVFTLAGSDERGLSAGASGAIFGILGALITFLAKRREHLTPAAKGLLLQLLFWAGLNVFLGISVAAIDNSAHMGGFAAGLLLGAFLKPLPRHRHAEEVAARQAAEAPLEP
jgi:rhomboid protease GluP